MISPRAVAPLFSLVCLERKPMPIAQVLKKSLIGGTFALMLLVGMQVHAKPAKDFPHAFDFDQDLLIAQYDSNNDPDDIQAQAAFACMMQSPELHKLKGYGVLGAYGDQSPKGFGGCPEFFGQIFGVENEEWTMAHPQYSENWRDSVARTYTKARETLLEGGRVWVAEAGQSDFTWEWVERLLGDAGVANDLVKSHVVVVQHSWWNYQMTHDDDLLNLQNHTTYFGPRVKENSAIYDEIQTRLASGQIAGLITNGNGAFRSNDQKWHEAVVSESNPNAFARNIWTDAYAVILEGHIPDHSPIGYDPPGIDYSDIVAIVWILDFDELYNASFSEGRQLFWDRFMVNVLAE